MLTPCHEVSAAQPQESKLLDLLFYSSSFSMVDVFFFTFSVPRVVILISLLIIVRFLEGSSLTRIRACMQQDSNDYVFRLYGH